MHEVSKTAWNEVYFIKVWVNTLHQSLYEVQHADQHSSTRHKEDINKECTSAKGLTRLQGELKSTSQSHTEKDDDSDRSSYTTSSFSLRGKFP